MCQSDIKRSFWSPQNSFLFLIVLKSEHTHSLANLFLSPSCCEKSEYHPVPSSDQEQGEWDSDPLLPVAWHGPNLLHDCLDETTPPKRHAGTLQQSYNGGGWRKQLVPSRHSQCHHRQLWNILLHCGVQGEINDWQWNNGCGWKYVCLYVCLWFLLVDQDFPHTDKQKLICPVFTIVAIIISLIWIHTILFHVFTGHGSPLVEIALTVHHRPNSSAVLTCVVTGIHPSQARVFWSLGEGREESGLTESVWTNGSGPATVFTRNQVVVSLTESGLEETYTCVVESEETRLNRSLTLNGKAGPNILIIRIIFD